LSTDVDNRSDERNERARGRTVSEHHVGLDIGSFGVRAAEVSVEGGTPVLHRFAQLTLPPGAVIEGEVADASAVAATVRRLWSKGGFKATKVVVGVSTRDVKVRQAELPALEPGELRSSLRYEAHDLIPFADADSVVDFIVHDRFTRDGADLLRVLVVAAPRAHIDAAVAAVSAAGLEVEAVELVPFALVRSLCRGNEPGTGEVIVSVGAGLTSVVVECDGVPQLVRTTPGGGGAITEALAARLSVRYEEAEAIKRMASPLTAEGAVATALIDEQLGELVREIVGSVDYFVAQTPEVDIRRIILTGSGSLVPGLRERIRAESQLEVVPADALRNVALGKTRLTPEQLVAASTTLAGPIGLALAPDSDPASRLTALLPESYVRRLGNRREAKVTAVALAALLLLLMGIWVHRASSVRNAHADVSRTSRLVDSLTTKDVLYGRYAAENSDLQRRTKVVSAALADDVDTAGLLDQVSAHLPSDVWLRSVSLTMPTAKSAGSASFTLGGIDGNSPAHWLEQMRSMTSVFGQVYVSGISTTAGPHHSEVTFSSTATLAPGVISSRASAFGMPK
jgi:type IV pilus assembly protein PilM